MFKRKPTKSSERKLQERQDIKEEKKVGLAQRERLPDSPCRTMTSQTNENNMSMTRDKRNASNFIVRARWTVMPVCEQTQGRKNRMERKITSNMDLSWKSESKTDIFTQLNVRSSMP